MTTRQDIIDFARTLIGIPWVHQGRNEFGLDCGGMIIHVAKTLKLSEFDIGRYSRRPTKAQFVDHMRAGGAIPISISKIQPGDILVVKFQTYPCHCGIIGEKFANGKMNLSFIHSYEAYGGVTEELLEPHWMKRAHSAFKFPGVTDG